MRKLGPHILKSEFEVHLIDINFKENINMIMYTDC